MFTHTKLFVVCLIFSHLVSSDPVEFQSTSAQTGFLELYTSEGCSSCPPADRWLTSLKQDKGLWKDFIPAAFHVNYWDYIGWKDPFATELTTFRQRIYAQENSIDSVYTPGFVYNGKEWRSWFARKTKNFPEGDNPGVLKLNVDGEQALVQFNPNDTHNELFINVAVLGFDLTTKVRAGENKGRELTHDFVVLGFTKVKLIKTNNAYKAQFKLPTTRTKANSHGIVVWVSGDELQVPLQATGGYLRSL